MELTCPKCRGTMHTYERNGVHVDQCQECRGIFLDRGELERLVDAENAWHGGSRQDGSEREQRASGSPSSSGGGLGAVVGEVLGQVRGQKHGSSGHGSDYGHQRRKKESFLGDLFG
jgi:Zn-finger nucleic acid-binding protein